MAAKKKRTEAVDPVVESIEPEHPEFDFTPLFNPGSNPRISWALHTLLEEMREAYPDVLFRFEGANQFNVCVDVALNVPLGHRAEQVVALLAEDSRISSVERSDAITMKVHLRDVMALYDRRDAFGISGADEILGGIL